MTVKRKPESLQPGDEQIAREEVEAYYTHQITRALMDFSEAQRRLESATAKANASIEGFRRGERLPEIDAWSIELHAGGVDEFHEPVFLGLPVDRAAYDEACARRDATKRWLRHQGYPELDGRSA